jgi:hypothetical protein
VAARLTASKGFVLRVEASSRLAGVDRVCDEIATEGASFGRSRNELRRFRTTAMDAETSAGRIAAIAQSEPLWARFVGSGEADRTHPALLRRAKKDLQRGLKQGQGDVREGLERILSYLAGDAQGF